MTLQEAKEQFGATHYTVMKDGVTPQMLYKQEQMTFSDGTSLKIWVYLSYCNIWMGSGFNREKDLQYKLKLIPEVEA